MRVSVSVHDDRTNDKDEFVEAGEAFKVFKTLSFLCCIFYLHCIVWLDPIAKKNFFQRIQFSKIRSLVYIYIYTHDGMNLFSSFFSENKLSSTRKKGWKSHKFIHISGFLL